MPDNPQPNVIVVIPARHASSRFPGKPLASIAGRPMIRHVFERAKQSQRASRVVVATDDNRIRDAVLSFGGEVIMTRSEHRTGTDRLAEVAVHIPADIYVNVQGDLPLILPEVIDAVVDALISAGDEAQVSTLCVPITTPEDIMNPNIVKVVSDFDGNALYFSRAPIPWVRDAGERVAARHFKHIGLYAFRRDALLEFPALPPGDLERLEQLEQLRWMENGYRIAVAERRLRGRRSRRSRRRCPRRRTPSWPRLLRKIDNALMANLFVQSYPAPGVQVVPVEFSAGPNGWVTVCLFPVGAIVSFGVLLNNVHPSSAWVWFGLTFSVLALLVALTFLRALKLEIRMDGISYISLFRGTRFVAYADISTIVIIDYRHADSQATPNRSLRSYTAVITPKVETAQRPLRIPLTPFPDAARREFVRLFRPEQWESGT